jgi:hypothetical protein
MEGEPELWSHKRVMDGHGCSDAWVGTSVENDESGKFYGAWEHGKEAQFQERADHTGEVCHVALKRAEEDDEVGFSGKRPREVL